MSPGRSLPRSGSPSAKAPPRVAAHIASEIDRPPTSTSSVIISPGDRTTLRSGSFRLARATTAPPSTACEPAEPSRRAAPAARLSRQHPPQVPRGLARRPTTHPQQHRGTRPARHTARRASGEDEPPRAARRWREADRGRTPGRWTPDGGGGTKHPLQFLGRHRTWNPPRNCHGGGYPFGHRPSSSHRHSLCHRVAASAYGQVERGNTFRNHRRRQLRRPSHQRFWVTGGSPSQQISSRIDKTPDTQCARRRRAPAGRRTGREVTLRTDPGDPTPANGDCRVRDPAEQAVVVTVVGDETADGRDHPIEFLGPC
jgi:hypothetical protein